MIVNILLCCLLNFSFNTLSYAEISREYRLKANFVLQFIRFTQWPKEVDQQHIIIGILGDNPFDDYLTRLSTKLQARWKKKFTFEYYQTFSQVKHPHILFISQSTVIDPQVMSHYIASKPILTISEQTHFSTNCGIIWMYTKNNKIKLDINPDQATVQNIKISSNLLRIANIVTNKVRCL